MAEVAIDVSGLSRQEAYRAVEDALAAVLEGEDNLTARMATTACLLRGAFADRYFWSGFYCVDPAQENMLVVGPYQGTMGCLRIPFGRGVCGTAAAERKTQVVPDVNALANHISCDALSQSEIVVPVFNRAGDLIAVFDVDATVKNAFDERDQAGLESLLARIFAA